MPYIIVKIDLFDYSSDIIRRSYVDLLDCELQSCKFLQKVVQSEGILQKRILRQVKAKSETTSDMILAIK